jgi:hypothetical protein
VIDRVFQLIGVELLMVVLRELRDPVGIALAAAGALVVLLLQQGLETTVLVGAAILVFRVAAGLAIERFWPTPAAVPPGSPWYFPPDEARK